MERGSIQEMERKFIVSLAMPLLLVDRSYLDSFLNLIYVLWLDTRLYSHTLEMLLSLTGSLPSDRIPIF